MNIERHIFTSCHTQMKHGGIILWGTIILKLFAHASLIIKSAVAAKFYMLQTNLHNTGENLSIN